MLVLYPASSPGFFVYYETVCFMPMSSKRATERARESGRWLQQIFACQKAKVHSQSATVEGCASHIHGVSHKFEMLVKYVTSGLGVRLINLLVYEPFGLVHKTGLHCSNLFKLAFSITGG